MVTAGPILANVLEGCKGLHINFIYFPTIKPIDKELVSRLMHTRFLVVHDGFGLREAINEVPVSDCYHGLPDVFCAWYGTVHAIRQQIVFDSAEIRLAVEAATSNNS